jgi:hypothetical protein
MDFARLREFVAWPVYVAKLSRDQVARPRAKGVHLHCYLKVFASHSRSTLREMAQLRDEAHEIGDILRYPS